MMDARGSPSDVKRKCFLCNEKKSDLTRIVKKCSGYSFTSFFACKDCTDKNSSGKHESNEADGALAKSQSSFNVPPKKTGSHAVFQHMAESNNGNKNKIGPKKTDSPVAFQNMAESNNGNKNKIGLKKTDSPAAFRNTVECDSGNEKNKTVPKNTLSLRDAVDEFQQLKIDIFSILAVERNPVTAEQLDVLYQKRVGRRIPISNFNFLSVDQYLQSLKSEIGREQMDSETVYYLKKRQFLADDSRAIGTSRPVLNNTVSDNDFSFGTAEVVPKPSSLSVKNTDFHLKERVPSKQVVDKTLEEDNVLPSSSGRQSKGSPGGIFYQVVTPGASVKSKDFLAKAVPQTAKPQITSNSTKEENRTFEKKSAMLSCEGLVDQFNLVRSNILAVISQQKKPVSAGALAILYSRSFGTEIPVKELGFEDLDGYLRSLASELVQLSISGRSFYSKLDNVADSVSLKVSSSEPPNDRRAVSDKKSPQQSVLSDAVAEVSQLVTAKKPSYSKELADRFKILKADAVSVLIAEKTPVSAMKFEQLYKNHFKKEICYRDFGFRTLDELLQSFAGAVSYFPEGRFMKYFFAKNDDMFLNMVRKMVQQQKDTVRDYELGTFRTNFPNSSFPPAPKPSTTQSLLPSYGAPPQMLLALKQMDSSLYSEFIAMNQAQCCSTTTGNGDSAPTMERQIENVSTEQATSSTNVIRRYDRNSLMVLYKPGTALCEDAAKFCDIAVAFNFQPENSSGNPALVAKSDSRSFPKLDTILEIAELSNEVTVESAGAEATREMLPTEERCPTLDDPTGEESEHTGSKDETSCIGISALAKSTPVFETEVEIEDAANGTGCFEILKSAESTSLLETKVGEDSVPNEDWLSHSLQQGEVSFNHDAANGIQDMNGSLPNLSKTELCADVDLSPCLASTSPSAPTLLQSEPIKDAPVVDDSCDHEEPGLMLCSDEKDCIASCENQQMLVGESGSSLVLYDQALVPFVPFSDWLTNYETTRQVKIDVRKQERAFFYFACDANPELHSAYERLDKEMRAFYKTFKVADVQMRRDRINPGHFCVVCSVSETAFDFVFKRGRIIYVHEDDTVDVECLDDVTYANIESTAVLELDARFTELPLRYAPIRFRALKSIAQDLLDNVEEIRDHCVAAMEGSARDGHNLIVVGFDDETQQFVVDVIVRRDLGYCTLLSLIAAFLYGVPYRAEFEEEVWAHFENFVENMSVSR